MFMEPRRTVSAQPLDPRQLQEDWDREGRTAHMRLLRRDAILRANAERLERFSARFAYVAISLTALAFLYHGARYAARVWGLA